MTTYSKQTWVDAPAITSPLSATRLNHMEDGIFSANTGISYPVDAYGADPTGVAFSDTAFAAAITAMGTGPGVLDLGVGVYKLASTKTLNHPLQGVVGKWPQLSILNYTGTGPCLRVYDSTITTNQLPGVAGPLRGFSIWGWSNANTNISGIEYGDLMNPDVDVLIEGFQTAGARAFYGHNVTSWCEGGRFRLKLRYSTNLCDFDGDSWAYSDYDLWLDAQPNQNGIRIGAGAVAGFNGVRMLAQGNFRSTTSPTNTGVALTVGANSVLRGNIQMAVECNDSGAAFTDINVGSGGVIEGIGLLQFQAYGTAWQAGTASAYNTFIAGRTLPRLAPVLLPPPILYDSFTAADGTALDSAKWTVTTGGAGAAAATTNGNRARFTTGATGGYSGTDKVFAVSTVPSSLVDVEILFRHTFGAVANESYSRYAVRATNTDPQLGNSYYVAIFGNITVTKTVSNAATDLFTSNYTSLGLTAPANGGMKWVRLRVKDTTIAMKIWDEGTSEPLAWTYSGTDSSVSAGGSVIAAISGGSAAASGINYVDQFHIYAL